MNNITLPGVAIFAALAVVAVIAVMNALDGYTIHAPMITVF